MEQGWQTLEEYRKTIEDGRWKYQGVQHNYISANSAYINFDVINPKTGCPYTIGIQSTRDLKKLIADDREGAYKLLEDVARNNYEIQFFRKDKNMFTNPVPLDRFFDAVEKYLLRTEIENLTENSTLPTPDNQHQPDYLRNYH